MDRTIRSKAQKSVSQDRLILHIDFDSYFASCEQHFNPNLRGKPIGVTAENGRNCIIAASRQAKKLGIKSPSATWEARAICPDIILVKADFDRYLDITKKFIEIASSYSPLVEAFSLDEVFIDMTPTLHLYKNLDDIVLGFKKRLADEIGPVVTVSVGVSYNKLVAKIASGTNKPDGYAVISKSEIDTFYKNIELTDVCGIGERLKRRLNMLGVYTLLELRSFPLALLKKEFGNACSQHLRAISLGIDDSPVVSFMEDVCAKSVGRNYCLPENTYDREKIKKILFELCEEIALKLRRIGKRARTIGLYLSGEGGSGGQTTTKSYLNTGQDIFDMCMKLYNSWKNVTMVRQVGIWTSNFIDEQYVTPTLFENPVKARVTQAIDNLNVRFGRHAVRRGYLLYAPKLTTKPNGFLGDREIRQSLRAI